MNANASFVVVILAAGESRRFGSPKQLASWKGKPMLLDSIKKVRACGITPVVALGANNNEILNNVDLKPYLDDIIFIEKWFEGLSQTIVESVTYLEKRKPQGIVFILADQPLISLRFYKEFFTEAAVASTRLLGTSYEKDGVLGVPAYFPMSYFNLLKELKGDRGAKWLLKQYGAKLLSYNGTLMDVDEPEDLVRASCFKLEP